MVPLFPHHHDFTTSVCLDTPLVAEMQHLRLLSNWVYKIRWAVLPSEAARDFRGILWTFMGWQWLRLKSSCSGKAEEPVVPFRCHRKCLHPAWNLKLVTWKCSQKVLVLPSSSGGKSVMLNYNLKRKKTPHLLQHRDGYLLVCFFLVKIVPSRSELGRKAYQIIAMITVGCAKLPQGLKLWVNTFVLGAEDHSLMQELMVYSSIKIAFQRVSGIGECAFFHRAAAQ